MNVGDDGPDRHDVDDTVARRGRPAGFVSSTSLSAHTLAEGSRLLDYEITGVVGEGGFGIVYLAWDPALERRIAIKEYLPSSMASRAASSATVVLKSERHADTFRAGLKSFVNEARLLARFNHPALVRVYRFWEQNGTAYMVMPYYEGPTLKQVLALRREPPSEAELRAWLRPLLDALAVMHAAQCFHRDIAPDNILLTPTGPLLLDFGAARRVIGDMTHALTVVLKPGYAPIEQYGEVASMAQGAWTDLYALASVVHAALTGRPPMSSVERLMDDRQLLLLARLAGGRYSASFLRAIDAALALRPADRPQDVTAFRALLGGGPAEAPPERRAEAPPERRPTHAEREAPASARPVVIREAGHALALQPEAEVADPGTVALPAPLPAAGRRPLPSGANLLLMAAAVVALLGTAAYRQISGRETSHADGAAAAASTASMTPAPPSTSASAAPSPTSDTLAPPATASAPASASASMFETARVPVRAPARAPTPRPRRDPQSAAAAAATSPAVTEDTSARASSRAKCSDILQKASLEALAAGEAAYLKRECR